MDAHKDDQVATERHLAGDSDVASEVAAAMNKMVQELTDFANNGGARTPKPGDLPSRQTEDVKKMAASEAFIPVDRNADLSEKQLEHLRAVGEAAKHIREVSLENTDRVCMLTDAFEAADAALRALEEDLVEEANRSTAECPELIGDADKGNLHGASETLLQRDSDRHDADGIDSLEVVLGTDQLVHKTISRPAQKEFEAKNKRTGRTYPMPTQNILDEIVYFQENAATDSEEKHKSCEVEEHHLSACEPDELVFRAHEINDGAEIQRRDHDTGFENALGTEQRMNVVPTEETSSLKGLPQKTENFDISVNLTESNTVPDITEAGENETGMDTQNEKVPIQTAEVFTPIMKVTDETPEERDEGLKIDDGDKQDQLAMMLSRNYMENPSVSQPISSPCEINEQYSHFSINITEPEQTDGSMANITPQVEANKLLGDQASSDDLQGLEETAEEMGHLETRSSPVHVEDLGAFEMAEDSNVEGQIHETRVMKQDQKHVATEDTVSYNCELTDGDASEVVLKEQGTMHSPDHGNRAPHDEKNGFEEMCNSENQQSESRKLEAEDCTSDENFETLFDSFMSSHKRVKMMVANFKEQPPQQTVPATSDFEHNVIHQAYDRKDVQQLLMLQKTAELEPGASECESETDQRPRLPQAAINHSSETHTEPFSYLGEVHKAESGSAFLEKERTIAEKDSVRCKTVQPCSEEAAPKQFDLENAFRNDEEVKTDKRLSGQLVFENQAREGPIDSDETVVRPAESDVAPKENSVVFGQNKALQQSEEERTIQEEISCIKEVVTVMQNSKTLEEQFEGRLAENTPEETAQQLDQSKPITEQCTIGEEMRGQEGSTEEKWQNIVPKERPVSNVQKLHMVAPQPEVKIEPQEGEMDTMLGGYEESDHPQSEREPFRLSYLPPNGPLASINVVFQEQNLFATHDQKLLVQKENDTDFDDDSLMKPPVLHNEKQKPKQSTEEKDPLDQCANKSIEYRSSEETVFTSCQTEYINHSPYPPAVQPELEKISQESHSGAADDNNIRGGLVEENEITSNCLDRDVHAEGASYNGAKEIVKKTPAKNESDGEGIPSKTEAIGKNNGTDTKQSISEKRQRERISAANAPSGKSVLTEPKVVGKQSERAVKNVSGPKLALKVDEGALVSKANLKSTQKVIANRGSGEKKGLKVDKADPRIPPAKVPTSNQRASVVEIGKKSQSKSSKTIEKPKAATTSAKTIERRPHVVAKPTQSVEMVKKTESKLFFDPHVRKLQIKTEQIDESEPKENIGHNPTTKHFIKPVSREPIEWLETLVPAFETLWVSCMATDGIAHHGFKSLDEDLAQRQASVQPAQETLPKVKSDVIEPVLPEDVRCLQLTVESEAIPQQGSNEANAPLPASKLVNTSKEESPSQYIVTSALGGEQNMAEAAEAVFEKHSEFLSNEESKKHEELKSIDKAFVSPDTPPGEETSLESTEKDFIHPFLRPNDFESDTAVIISPVCALNTSLGEQHSKESCAAEIMSSDEYAHLAQIGQNTSKEEVGCSPVADGQSLKETITSLDHNNEGMVLEVTSTEDVVNKVTSTDNINLDTKVKEVDVTAPAAAAGTEHPQNEQDAQTVGDEAPDEKPSRPRQHGRGQFRGSMMCEQKGWRQSNGKQENKQKQPRAQQTAQGDSYGQHSSQHKSKRRSRKSGRGQKGSQGQTS